MGFNKKIVPNIEKAREYAKDPVWLERTIKADALIGPTESIDYIHQQWDILVNSKKQSKILNDNTHQNDQSLLD